MFNNLYDMLDELDVIYENFNYESDNEDDSYLINDVSELEEFLLNNINENTLIPSEDEYPILVSWYRVESFDRHGDVSIKLMNFISMKEIKNVDDFIDEYIIN